jgi:hypothetical protein
MSRKSHDCWRSLREGQTERVQTCPHGTFRKALPRPSRLIEEGGNLQADGRKARAMPSPAAVTAVSFKCSVIRAGNGAEKFVPVFPE